MYRFCKLENAYLWLKSVADGDASVLVSHFRNVQVYVYEWQTAPAIWRDMYGPVAVLKG